MYAFIGFIASLIFIVAYYFQVKSLILSSSVKGISLVFWILIALATSITFHNLYLHNAIWYVIIPQFINAFVALFILVWVAYKKLRYYGIFIVFMVYVFLVSVFVIKIDSVFIQHSASAFIFFAYIEQTLYMIRKRTSQGINPMLYIGFGIGLFIMVINIIVTKAPIETAYTEICNIVAIIIGTITTYYYQKKQEIKQ